MSDSNPILFSSAQSIEAYQQAIEQSTQAVMQWLKQHEMYQGKTVAELRDRIKLDFNPKGLGNEAAMYDGSWSEWGADRSTPKAMGAA